MKNCAHDKFNLNWSLFDVFKFRHVKTLVVVNTLGIMLMPLGTRQKLKTAAGMFVVILLLCGNAFADARSEYLINMLQNGGSYRVRVQAANTLGQIRCQDGVPALVRALNDDHELVVISAATALGQIADTSVIPKVAAALNSNSNKAAKSQLQATLRVLKALSGEGAVEDAQSAKPEFLIHIDAMGNSSEVQRDELTDLLRNVVIKRLRREPGVIIQEPGMTAKSVTRKLKKEKLRGYILSGSILRMEHSGDQLIVKLSLNVFTNPGYNLLIMPSAEGAVPVIAGPMTRKTEQAAQMRALKAVAEALIGNVFKTLHTLDD